MMLEILSSLTKHHPHSQNRLLLMSEVAKNITFQILDVVSINQEIVCINANRACSFIVFVELLEASRILNTVSQTGRVRIHLIVTKIYVTIKFTVFVCRIREATKLIILKDQVVLLTLTC